MEPNGSELRHTVNGWLENLRAQQATAVGSRSVTVQSSLGIPRSLHTTATSLSTPVINALQRDLRKRGFKDAVVEPLLRGDGGGFTVLYRGTEYTFWIEEDKMKANGRGIYYQAGPSKNDIVIQPNRDKFRIDLVTSAGGNHTDVTGVRGFGYNSAEEAFQAALDVQRTRGIRGKSHVWIQRGEELLDYEPEEARMGHNGAMRHNPSFDLKKYGNQMQQWHSGMDAIYAVGSYASSGKVHPDPGTIERAQALLEGYSRSSKFNARDQREAKLLAQQTGELIGAPRDADALDEFTHAFFEAALFSTNDESNDAGGDPLDDNYSISDIDESSIRGLAAECARFQEENSDDLATSGQDDSKNGYMFWMTRNGHGVGFWDGDYPEPQATRLTEASKAYGEVSLYVGDDKVIYASGYEPGAQTPNGPRTGILSDGTRVNVYHKPGTLDEYTAVPHSEAWDSMEHSGMRSMLATSRTGSGFSQWTEGQEGRHLGRKLAWQEVPDELKRHIESRVVGEASMASNGRSQRTRKAPKPETLDQQWDKAEQAGLVREIQEPEIENYFDVYGYPDSREEREQIEDLIQLHGLWMYGTQYLDQETGQWVTAESVGMVFGNDLSDLDRGGYGPDFKRAALQNVYGGHTPNARGSTVDAHAVTELSLYIENDYALIGAPTSMGKSIDANLRKKVTSGTYNSTLAPRAWLHLVDAGAKKYTKEFGSGGAVIFSAATRRKVAEDFARAWEHENIAAG